MKDIDHIIKDGISIKGDPVNGYEVFTLPTQRFRVNSLADLTPERFNAAIQDLIEREKIETEILMNMDFGPIYLDFAGYIDGKYDENKG